MSQSNSNEEIAMKPVSSIVVLAALAASVAACSVQGRTYYPRQQYAYAPGTTTYYSAPGATVVATTPAPAYYSYDQPSFQKSNVYSSRWDYYRNYQGIHDGPERTGW
jgi:hypothetical protein